MADVLLRECITELRGHVRERRFSDALALGQHILHYYPKHIETYALLAQACIETNDLAGAADLFRRVQSADPENVVALTGLALLSEAQDKYDDALWYLERAFEIQPVNDDLRRELVRLREAYFGAAPERLELTPGALARGYARQGMYAQAIAEFRLLLRTDPQRYDAMVALAETLYRAGRTDESAQVAQKIVDDAPFALKPNIILGALWTENQVPEAERFTQRAYALDPEERTARDLLGKPLVSDQPPRLPMPNLVDATALPAPTTDAVEDETLAHAANLLRQIESAQELEPSALEQAQLPEDMESVALVAAATRGARAAAGETTESPVEIAADSVAASTAAAPAPTPNGAGREAAPAVSTEAIAAAAAALATSIARDKANQPAPTRRAFSAIPKVRPVIRSAQEQLPPWLYIAAPPAAAMASFDTPPQTDAERIVPLGGSQESSASSGVRPAWLVEAQSVAQDEPSVLAPNDDLPDWLRPAGGAVVVEQSASSESPDNVPAAPTDSLVEEQIPDAETAHDAPGTADDGWTDTPAPLDSTTPAWLSAAEQAPTDVRAEPHPAAVAPERAEPASTEAEPAADAAPPAAESTPQPVPDSAAMLEMARAKRAEGDLKGALELYERVMHRRPNHLDEVTHDLAEVASAEGAPLTAHRLLGEAYAMAGRFKESLEQYRIAMGK